MQTEIDRYKIKMVDLPECLNRFGRVCDGEVVMVCGDREYMKVEVCECIQCKLNL